MDSVESLEELIDKLDQSDFSNLGKIIRQMNISPNEFESYASWDKKGYTRNCINRNNEYELILLCWRKGDTTPIHGHGGQICWVYQIEGQMTEIRYKKDRSGNLIEANRKHLSPGMTSFMSNSMGYHKLNNDTNGRALTLHIYVSPITSCEVFNEIKKDFEFKELEYDTIHGNAFAELE